MARMSTYLGMDPDTCAWIAEPVRLLYAVEVEQELAFYRGMQD